MKIVSDFDGVLTDIASEAPRVEEWFVRYLSDFALIPSSSVSQILTQAQNRMESEPFSHGWRFDGKISAFWNEDGFIKVNAIAAYLDAESTTNKILAAGREFLPSLGIQSYTDLAQKAYRQTTEETARGSHHPMEKAAVEAVAHFLKEGASVVVVSNSETERIRQLLGAEGLPLTSSQLKIRGGAGKFKLGSQPRPLFFSQCTPPFSIDTDRPLYESVLTEEAPDHVFGDVFSLDLALPLFLRRSGVGGLKGTRVWLRRRTYTPHWSRSLFSTGEAGVRSSEGGVFDNFGEFINGRKLY